MFILMQWIANVADPIYIYNHAQYTPIPWGIALNMSQVSPFY